MSFFDIIRDLRIRESDVAKAARTQKIIGWFCFLTGAWNFIVTQLMPFERSPFKLPPGFPVLIFAFFFALGALFLLSARGILNREPWGRRLGQAAVVILVAAIPLLVVKVFNWSEFPFSSISSLIFVIFFILFIGQIVVPAWIGIRYLGRLPVIGRDRPDGVRREAGKVRSMN